MGRELLQFRVPDEFFLESGDSLGTRAMGRFPAILLKKKTFTIMLRTFG
jgi:hypothetical protein